MLLRHRITILAGLLGVLYIAAVTAYMVFDHHSLIDAMWWGFMTFTTVGYGDQYPTSLFGRIAGVMLVMTAVFVVIPSITAVIASRLIVDQDAWTHEEQEEVKTLLRSIDQRMERERTL